MPLAFVASLAEWVYVVKLFMGFTHFVDYVTKSVAYLIRFDLAITFSITFN